MMKDAITVVKQASLENYLKDPGDSLSARITKTHRRVLTVETNNGAGKYSRTDYPNGTVFETKTTKKR